MNGVVSVVGVGLRGGTVKRSRMNKAGKKTNAWAAERAKLKVRFLAAGITTCELRGRLEHECTYDNFLGFAHDAKRTKLAPGDLSRVILIDNNAHDIIEHWPHEEMKKIVNDTIAAREVQP